MKNGQEGAEERIDRMLDESLKVDEIVVVVVAVVQTFRR